MPRPARSYSRARGLHRHPHGRRLDRPSCPRCRRHTNSPAPNSPLLTLAWAQGKEPGKEPKTAVGRPQVTRITLRPWEGPGGESVGGSLAARGVTPGGRNSEWRLPRKSRGSPQPRVALSQPGLRPPGPGTCPLLCSRRAARACVCARVCVCAHVRACACARGWLREKGLLVLLAFGPGVVGRATSPSEPRSVREPPTQLSKSQDAEPARPPAAFLQGSGPPGSRARPSHPVTSHQKPCPPEPPAPAWRSQRPRSTHERGTRGEKGGRGSGAATERRGRMLRPGCGEGGQKGSSEPFCVPQDLRQRGVAVIRPGGRKLAGLGGERDTHEGAEAAAARGGQRVVILCRGSGERRGRRA